MRDIYNGNRKYAYPTPLVPGTSAIGRIAAVGEDASSLIPGRLVFIDCVVRGRDDPTKVFLSGIHEGFSEGSRKLMYGEWRDSTYSEFAKVPLENCLVLNEERLLGSPALEEGGFGYRVEDLAYISALLVPFGGLNDIGLKAGETVIVAPATGPFGGAAVQVALAMGAQVIAMGRNLDALADLAVKNDRVRTVSITGDMEADCAALKKFGSIDVFFDISPPAAAKSTHLKSAILALRHSGRVSLMGGIRDDIAIPHSFVMHLNIRIQGKWMYERQDIIALVKMIETGGLKLGESAGLEVVGKFGLEDWDSAFTTAAKNAFPGKSVIIAP